MKRLTVSALPLPGLHLITRQRIGDNRGFFTRVFCAEELDAAGWTRPIAQINHTYTGRRGTVRGMHYQTPPNAEMKLVTCLRGEVWDVAVDLRAGSATCGKWHGEHLSSDDGRAMLIPEGFAHGFQALTDDVELLYCHSAAYAPDSEAGWNPRDTTLSISWPLAISEMSPRDTQLPFLDPKFPGVVL